MFRMTQPLLSPVVKVVATSSGTPMRSAARAVHWGRHRCPAKIDHGAACQALPPPPPSLSLASCRSRPPTAGSVCFGSCVLGSTNTTRKRLHTDMHIRRVSCGHHTCHHEALARCGTQASQADVLRQQVLQCGGVTCRAPCQRC